MGLSLGYLRPGIGVDLSVARTLTFKRVLIALLCVDAALILVNFSLDFLRLVGVETSRPEFWLIYENHSLASRLTYLKWAAMVVLLGASAYRFRAPVLAALFAFFCYVLVDDVLEIHERAGHKLGLWFNLPGVFGMPPGSVGELLFLSVMATGALVFLLAGAWLSHDRWRRIALAFIIGLAGLFFFGVVVDAIHAMTKGLPAGMLFNTLDSVLGLIEESGEMVMASCLTALAMTLWFEGASLPLIRPQRGL